jgi:hypothetical protein
MIAGIAKEIIDSQQQKVGEVKDLLNRRQILVPSLLQTYCNVIELLRMRQEIIFAATECTVLQAIYQRQC